MDRSKHKFTGDRSDMAHRIKEQSKAPGLREKIANPEVEIKEKPRGR